MLRNLSIALIALLVAEASLAHESDDLHHRALPNGEAEGLAFPVDAHQLGIQINGVVCSFCAYGLEKALAKLDVVDTSQGQKGVLVDIDHQRLYVALKPASRIDFADIVQRIVGAGYEPVRFYFRLFGEIEETSDEDGRRVVAGRDPVLTVSFSGASLGSESGEFAGIVNLDAEVAKAAKREEPIRATIDARL